METASTTLKQQAPQESALFKRILLPIDDDFDLSQRAVSLGLAMARLCGARLVVLHAIPPFNSLACMSSAMLAATEIEYCDLAIKDSADRLKQVKETADTAQVACECHHSFGEHPHEAILGAVTEHHCDLIVMASHGRHGLDKLMLGSETQQVLARASVPVLVCR